MSFEDDKNGERRRKSDAPAAEEGAQAQPRPKRGRPSGEIGDALKSAYDRTLHEDIPPEMLDLLGKLG